VEWCGRVSAWGEIEQRKKDWRLGFVQGFYTTPGRALSRRGARRGCQRRGEDGHAVVLSSMRVGEDEDELLVLFRRRGTWAARWVGSGLLLGCLAGLLRPGESR
jgi:hypothetical protein